MATPLNKDQFPRLAAEEEEYDRRNKKTVKEKTEETPASLKSLKREVSIGFGTAFVAGMGFTLGSGVIVLLYMFMAVAFGVSLWR